MFTNILFRSSNFMKNLTSHDRTSSRLLMKMMISPRFNLHTSNSPRIQMKSLVIRKFSTEKQVEQINHEKIKQIDNKNIEQVDHEETEHTNSEKKLSFGECIKYIAISIVSLYVAGCCLVVLYCRNLADDDEFINYRKYKSDGKGNLVRI